MKHRLKGLLALVLSLVMVLGMVTVGSASQSSGGGLAPTTYPVSIGGVELTSDNISSYAGIRFTPTDGTNPATLTLNGFDGGAISASDDLAIVLEGENTITTTSDKGISVIGNLTIEGSNGKVTATGVKYGIYADTVTIKGGTVTATGDERCGIYTEDGNITISGGTVKATGDAHGIFANNVSHSGGMKVTISGGAVTANAADNGGIGIYANGGEIAISGDNTQVTVGCATGLKASTVNILENSTVTITTNATALAVGKAIDATTLNFGGNWYQWSENGGSVNISSNTNQLTVDAAKGVQTLTIEKISTGGPGAQQPPAYYPIYIPTVEDEPEVTAPDTFDGGIASAVVVTILSATGGAWLAKKKD